ncbi:MAG: arginine--tRNA ligase [bacterium]
MKDIIEQVIKQIIVDLFSVNKDIELTIPPEKSMGDFSTNIAFLLSKDLKINPREIAEHIKLKLLDSSNNQISDVQIAGPGFINIFINKNKFSNSVLDEIKNGNYFHIDLGKGKTISIEHTAANPNKHLHIGHLRNFSIADTLVRIMKKSGYEEVIVQWFNDDQGLQVAKVLWGIKNNIIETSSESYAKYDSYAAEVYVAAEKYLAQHEEKKDEISQIIKEMEEGNNETSSMAETVTRKIIEGQIETISKFGVYYDLMISESTMTQSGEVERILNELFKTGKVVKEVEGKNAGSIVIKGLKDSTGKDLDDKILVRSNGTAVYTGKDIVLHLWKYGLLNVDFQFENFESKKIGWNNNHNLYISVPHKINNSETKPQHADKHINVVDQRQSYPLEVVKQSLKVLGFEKQSDNYHHLAYETVTMSAETAKTLGLEIEEGTKSVAMSGRKGIEVPIDVILKKMTEEIIEKNKDKTEKLSEEEAVKIAASALRYYMIKFGYNTIIVFDIDDALRADGDSGIYLMYAYVRAKSILDKVEDKNIIENISEELDSSIFDLITHISFAKDVLKSVAETYEVNKLTTYTYELAKKFSDFYQRVNVSAEKDENKKAYYRMIVKEFADVYEQILYTLGLHTPDKM